MAGRSVRCLRYIVLAVADTGLPARSIAPGCNASQGSLKTGATECGRSSGVEHNLAKVGVEGSNPFARSRFSQ